MTTWLQRRRDTTFEREVAGVRLVGDAVAENTAPQLAVGGTVQLSPRMTDQSGWDAMKYTTAPTFAYESGDEAIATVHATNGLVTAVYVGSTDTTVDITVTATTPGAQEFEDTVTVEIPGDTVAATLVMTPATANVLPSATQQLTSVVKNAGAVTIAGAVVTYGTSNAAIATVSVTGLVTGVGDGVATITATSGAATDTTAITVDTVPFAVSITPPTVTLAALATQQLTKVVTNAAGQTLVSAVVTYVSSDPAKATVTSPGGLITAVATGETTVTGTAALGVTDTCVVTVS